MPVQEARVHSLANGVFALKLDPQGHVLWAKSYGDDAGQLSGAIASDAAANVYVAGALAGYLDTSTPPAPTTPSYSSSLPKSAR